MKHDPGPWAYKNGRIESSDGNQVVISEGPAFGSAAVWPKAKANSRIVLAAPELLAMLKTIVLQDDRQCLCQQTIENARSLIKKVEQQ